MFKLVTGGMGKEKAQRCLQSPPPLAAGHTASQKTEEEGSRLGPISLHSHFARLCLGEVSLCPLFHWA